MTAELVRATLEDMKLSKLGEWITATIGETLTALAQDTNEQRLRTAASRNHGAARAGRECSLTETAR